MNGRFSVIGKLSRRVLFIAIGEENGTINTAMVVDQLEGTVQKFNPRTIDVIRAVHRDMCKFLLNKGHRLRAGYISRLQPVQVNTR